MLELKEGGYYKVRNGEKVGPIKKTYLSDFPFRCGYNDWWKRDGYHEGTTYGTHNPSRDIIEEWTDTTPQTGTLKELNVKPGDVVEYPGGQRYTVSHIEKHLIHSGGVAKPYEYWDTSDFFRIISRAATRDPELTSPYGDNNHPLPDTKPKTWGEMTDAEKGALLLADHNGDLLEALLFNDKWEDKKNGFPYLDYRTYRVKPSPSHLPLTVGGMYELKNGRTEECVFIDGDKAVMRPNNNSSAYIWDVKTGASISLGPDWNIKGLAQ